MTQMQVPTRTAAEAVRAARGDQTQVEFAALVGLSQPYLSQLERGERRLTLESAVAIERGAGLEPYSLVRVAADAVGTLALPVESADSTIPGLLSRLALSAVAGGHVTSIVRPSPARLTAAA